MGIQQSRSIVQIALPEFSIDIFGDPDIRMPHQGLSSQRRHAGPEQRIGVFMPQLMRGNKRPPLAMAAPLPGAPVRHRGQPGGFQKIKPELREPAGGQRFSPAKDKIRRAMKPPAGTLQERPEGVQDRIHPQPRLRFGGPHHRSVPQMGHTFGDMDLTSIQVDVLPLQRKHLAPAAAGIKQKPEEQPAAMVGDQSVQFFTLVFHGPRAALLTAVAGIADGSADIQIPAIIFTPKIEDHIHDTVLVRDHLLRKARLLHIVQQAGDFPAGDFIHPVAAEHIHRTGDARHIGLQASGSQLPAFPLPPAVTDHLEGGRSPPGRVAQLRAVIGKF